MTYSIVLVNLIPYVLNSNVLYCIAAICYIYLKFFQASPLWDEETRLCQGLTRDQISRIPTRVFKSDTGKDTTKSKNAANLDTTNTEEPSGSAKVDDDDCKSATGVDNDSKGATEVDDIEECHVCYSEFVDNETLRILPCSHEFHIQCIDQWIRVSDVSVQKMGGGGWKE